jgi:hypothetical protein
MWVSFRGRGVEGSLRRTEQVTVVVTLYTCIHAVLGSNLDHENGCPKIFHGCSQSLYADVAIVPLLGHCPLPSISLQIHYSIIPCVLINDVVS